MTYPAVPLANQWTDNEDLNAALMNARIDAKLNLLVGYGPQGLLGSVVDSVNITTLATTADTAGYVSKTITLATQRRVKLIVLSAYTLNTAGNGHMRIYGGYNTGSSVAIGSVVRATNYAVASTTTTGSSGSQSTNAIGDTLLAAGTYTFYPVVTRTGGGATDTASAWYLAIEDVGAS